MPKFTDPPTHTVQNEWTDKMMSECVIDENDPFYANIFHAPMLSSSCGGPLTDRTRDNLQVE